MLCTQCAWSNPYTANLSFCPNCGTSPDNMTDGTTQGMINYLYRKGATTAEIWKIINK